MLFDLVCDLPVKALNSTAGRFLTSLTGRSASMHKMLAPNLKKVRPWCHNLQANTLHGFFKWLCARRCTVAVTFCGLQAHESDGSCQVTATSGWGHLRSPSGRCSEGAVRLCHRWSSKRNFSLNDSETLRFRTSSLLTQLCCFWLC